MANIFQAGSFRGFWTLALFTVVWWAADATAVAEAAVYYVAPSGNDANAGTESQPWKTVQKAADTLQPGDTVLIRGGIYRENVQPARGGTGEDGRVTYKAYPGETPILCGSEQIDNWFSNNQGAGIRAVQGTGSSAFTANRIEWNRGGNMVVRNAWGWNITGNSFDRAQGPSLYLMGNCHDFTITGNLFLRSGAVLERGHELAEHERCAVRLVGVDGLTFTGNSITVGGNDASMQKAMPTPETGLILNKLSHSVVAGNRLAGSKQGLLDLGEHGEQAILRDNVNQVITPK